jgi:Putative Actinobacterial Holin-X, holin superfamily III
MTLSSNNRPAGDKSGSDSPDWSTLLTRFAESLSRLVRAEILLWETRVKDNVTEVAERVVAQVVAFIVLALSAIFGLACILAAYIVLLHRWLPAWQACGVGGLTIILIGLIIFAILYSGARRQVVSH